MLKKRFISLSLILACSLLITACGKDKFEEVTYKKGFPKEDNPGLTELMKHYLSEESTDQEIIRKDGSILFSTLGNQRKDVQYFEYTEDQLKQYYKPILTAEDPKDTLDNLDESNRYEKSLYHSIKSKEKYNLPAIKTMSNNRLEVKTKRKIKVLDLTDILGEYGIKKSDDLEIYLEAVNSKCFSLVIQNLSYEGSKNLTMQLFLTQDLKNIETTMLNKESLQETLSTGKLKDYYGLYPIVDKSGRYIFLSNFFILDKKTNQLKEIKKGDYLSEDGKYVYLNGDKEEIQDGVQKIQTVDNYLKGNDEYEAQFKLDFENIAEEMDFKSSGTSIAQTCYFNENYVVLRISYNGMIVGTAGAVNVLIDLKNKKQPTAYLVDLGIMSRKVY
ncbi:hypothetical protein HOO54_21080 [Bacillus sp. WMMC1349]|uniref:hypothetical protein n=1 Tax=Bacillus sp. WMMC1349 TaxID=2736254 RepID=UPI0015553650|nr:hypothetical protein [Bacillus sp. WMMC1349]NPC94651.1 hypothetical protein [Bacillus sp. WMMC1349]